MNDHTEISKEELLLNAVVDTAIDGIVVINERGIIERINPAAAKLFGYEKIELLNQNVNRIAGSPHNMLHDTYLNNYLRTGEKKIIGIGREVNGLKKDGTVFPIRLSISEVSLTDRRLFTGIIHDLTKEKEAEIEIKRLNAELEGRVEKRTEELVYAVNQLLKTNKQLEFEVQERKMAEEALKKSEQDLRQAYEREKELNELKSRFVSMASHEFRTPLSTIQSSADLIQAYDQKLQQDKREKHIARIKNAVGHLTGVLNDFLSLTKLEEGKITSNNSIFEINQFYQEVMDEIKGLLKTGQKLQLHLLENPLEVELDAKFLKNILFNLISNAIKYSGEGAMIQGSLSIENQFLIIDITDQGLGIPEEDQPHLFTRFFRAHNVENIPGTGLGLNIVKKYVDFMNGDIRFQSTLGKGSTFKVCLPIHPTSNA